MKKMALLLSVCMVACNRKEDNQPQVIIKYEPAVATPTPSPIPTPAPAAPKLDSETQQFVQSFMRNCTSACADDPGEPSFETCQSFCKCSLTTMAVNTANMSPDQRRNATLKSIMPNAAQLKRCADEATRETVSKRIQL